MDVSGAKQELEEICHPEAVELLRGRQSSLTPSLLTGAGVVKRGHGYCSGRCAGAV